MFFIGTPAIFKPSTISMNTSGADITNGCRQDSASGRRHPRAGRSMRQASCGDGRASELHHSLLIMLSTASRWYLRFTTAGPFTATTRPGKARESRSRLRFAGQPSKSRHTTRWQGSSKNEIASGFGGHADSLISYWSVCAVEERSGWRSYQIG